MLWCNLGVISSSDPTHSSKRKPKNTYGPALRSLQKETKLITHNHALAPKTQKNKRKIFFRATLVWCNLGVISPSDPTRGSKKKQNLSRTITCCHARHNSKKHVRTCTPLSPKENKINHPQSRACTNRRRRSKRKQKNTYGSAVRSRTTP